MKKVMLFALMGIFTMSVFAQNQEKAKSDTKKDPAKTEVAKPAPQAKDAKAAPAKDAKAAPAKDAKAAPAKDAKPAEKKPAETPKK